MPNYSTESTKDNWLYLAESKFIFSHPYSASHFHFSAIPKNIDIRQPDE